MWKLCLVVEPQLELKQYQVAADDEARATTLQDAQERWKSERADLQVRHAGASQSQPPVP